MASDLSRFALASYLTGHGEGFVTAMEEAHQAHLDAGEIGVSSRAAATAYTYEHGLRDSSA